MVCGVWWEGVGGVRVKGRGRVGSEWDGRGMGTEGGRVCLGGHCWLGNGGDGGQRVDEKPKKAMHRFGLGLPWAGEGEHEGRGSLLGRTCLVGPGMRICSRSTLSTSRSRPADRGEERRHSQV